MTRIVTTQLSLSIELENYGVQLVLFEQTYVQLLTHTVMFSCHHLSLQSSVVERDPNEFGDCSKYQRVKQNLNQKNHLHLKHMKVEPCDFRIT